MRLRPVASLCILMILLSFLNVHITPASGQADPEKSTHPRLWIRADDISSLRSRAVDTNPFYSDGLLPLAENAKSEMDAGNVPGMDSGDITWEQYPSEMYSMLFAFMSLIANEQAVRDDYAERARTVLMYVMNEAAKGAAQGEPFRDPDFSTYDRSRWWGEGFALTVDWIYPYLSEDDKATIHGVFLRWADENMNAATTAFNHPEPPSTYNSPALLEDQDIVRWSANNYYLAHMRNIGLMALAFDVEDDPGGQLRGYLESATGAWLYVIDHLLRTDARGGFSPEGWQYGPESLGYTAQFLLALYTAGQADPLLRGEQVAWDANPFWDETIPALLHSLSPSTTVAENYDWLGSLYQPAWFGDGQEYWAPDFVGLFGPMGLYDQYTGNQERLDAIRWLQTHIPPGGEERLIERVGNTEVFRDAILYFLLFEPDAPPPTNPRSDLSLNHFAPGTGRILARTSWEEDATWFTYQLGWILIDHQLAEGNQFEFYRNGEWLTSARVGWDGTVEPYGCNIGRSDYHNNIAVENDQPDLEPDHYLYNCYLHGSQWIYVAAGDGELLAHSFDDRFVYALGDATALYNSAELDVMDVQHVSRSIIWLKPNHIIIYDRIETKTDGRFKRFWMNIPADASLDGNQATVTTEKDQQLVVTSLLPTGVEITEVEAEDFGGEAAQEQPMRSRLMIEAPGDPTSTRFLTVLQGLDAGSTPDAVSLITSNGTTAFEGASVRDIAILFPIDISETLADFQYQAEADIQTHIITGLLPETGYDAIVEETASGSVLVSVRPGGSQLTDSGGVLVIQVVE